MLFAHMKQQYRFTRLKLRGLAGAAEEFLLVATVQNLRPPHTATLACYPENIVLIDCVREKNNDRSPINRASAPGDPPISGVAGIEPPRLR